MNQASTSSPDRAADRIARQRLIADLGLHALAGGDFDPLLNRACASVADALEVEVVGLFELLPDERSLVLRTGIGWQAEDLGQARATGGLASLPGFTLSQDHPVVSHDVHNDSRFTISSLVAAQQVRCAVSAVIPGGRRPIGVLAAFSREDRSFDDDDAALVETVANVMALAIERRRDERRVSAQHDAMSALARSATLEQAAPQILEAICRATGWEVGSLWTPSDSDGSLRCLELWTAPGARVDAFATVTRDLALEVGADYPGMVMAGGGPRWRSDIVSDTRFFRRDEADEAGLHSGLWFPITAENQEVGVFEFLAGQIRQPDETLLDDMMGFGDQVGAFILHRRREQELRASEARYQRVASTLQQSLLPPSLPEVPSLQLAARFHAASEALEVGGDFYDVFSLAEPTWTVAIGDVAGKGADAAAVTSLARHSIRAGALGRRSPSAVLRTLNSVMSSGDSDRLCTALCANLTPLPHGGIELEAASAGHPRPLLVRTDGSCEWLECGGLMLGVEPEVQLDDVRGVLSPGDALVLYTDGITEARSPSGRSYEDRFFGAERLQQAACRLAGGTAEEIAAGIEEAVLGFERGALADDIALLVLRAT
ncbi:MAG: SpoIIE family protein phosphatase [Solirubrobacterales bacterium]